MIEKLQAYLQEDPNDTFSKFALALEYKKIGDVSRAIELFEEIHEANPDYVGIYYHLGKLYDQQDDNKKAIATYKEGIEVATQKDESKALSELKSALMELELNDE
ncbi:MAG TPA: tetratricopeptide repeat protein [Balneolales bacterium]|nr:tetratricopeptide repeat protein [Balneolales bacterium]